MKVITKGNQLRMICSIICSTLDICTHLPCFLAPRMDGKVLGF